MDDNLYCNWLRRVSLEKQQIKEVKREKGRWT
jgi:hypothetical protein